PPPPGPPPPAASPSAPAGRARPSPRPGSAPGSRSARRPGAARPATSPPARGSPGIAAGTRGRSGGRRPPRPAAGASPRGPNVGVGGVVAAVALGAVVVPGQVDQLTAGLRGRQAGEGGGRPRAPPPEAP